MDIKVEWTGKYPNLCSGKWIITIDGINLSIPSAFINSSMNTEKAYEIWNFDENYNEEWHQYYDGIGVDEWIKNNSGWLYASLKSINKENEITFEDLRTIFIKINELDWRNLSCGGCI